MHHMSTDTTSAIVCNSSKETEKFGALLGSRLKGGEVIELASDIGGGKTTLARGIAKGAGCKDIVSSPTFTLSKIYKAKNFQIHHFDFYRLAEPGIMKHELAELLEDKKAVVIVEWGDVLQKVLPAEKLTIKITKTGSKGRKLSYSFPRSLSYLLEAA